MIRRRQMMKRYVKKMKRSKGKVNKEKTTDEITENKERCRKT